MKQSKLAILGMILGLLYMGVTGWWFWYKYPDISQLVAHLMLGASFVGIWFNYNRTLVHLNHDHDKIEKKIDFLDSLMEEFNDELNNLRETK